MTQDQLAEIPAEAPNLPVTRHDGWTPSRQRLFLETLAGMGVVRAACRVAGMSYEAAYQFRLRADGLAFKLGWEAAAQIARRRLADDLMERSLEKQEEEVTRDGNVIRRCRYDNRVALGMLTRLDKFCREDSADTRLACMIEDDFSSFLDLVQKQGSEAALAAFVHARLDGTTAELLIKPAYDPGPIADPEPSALPEPPAPPVRAKAPPPVPTPETGPIRVVDPDTGIASIYMVPPQPPGLPPKWLRNRAGW